MRKVTAKKKCCKDETRCKKCPLVLKRLVEMGFAEQDGRATYQVSKKVPKKALQVARR